MPRPVPAVRRLVRIAVIAPIASTLLLLSACGAGEPRSIDPAGVDGLEIPTATPDPADFVRVVDNPWLPLRPGSVWTYESEVGTTTVSVTPNGEEIGGVRTTAVATLARKGRRSVTSTRYYAQDAAGNVWLLGADDWRAGVAGARAGLVMPATPRVGDGFVQYAAGAVEDRSVVLDVAASVTSPYGAWTDAVEIRDSTTLDPTADAVRFYAPGVGLVRTESSDGVLELVSFDPGD